MALLGMRRGTGWANRWLDARAAPADARSMRGAAVVIVLTLAACSARIPVPTAIPVGGARAAITHQNLVAARSQMAGGLVEPGWLPDGFVLVNADYDKAEGEIVSVDLVYDGAEHRLHLWQTLVDPAAMGETDPVGKGEPIEGTPWGVSRLPATQVGSAGVVEYAARLDDGRTVTIDTDLDVDTMRRVLESLLLGDADKSGVP